MDTWLRAWHRQYGRARGGRLTLDERLALVEALLARGADANARMTASEMARLGFLRNGAYDTFATGTGDLAGATPLWVAAYATNLGAGSASFKDRRLAPQSSGTIVERLLAAGARPELTPKDGTTTLMAAAGCGRAAHVTNVPRGPRQPMAQEAARILLDAGVDVNARNEGDYMALHCAAFTGVNELIRLFVQHGAEIDARDWRGADAVPPRRRRQADIPLSGVAGHGRSAARARRRHQPWHPRDDPRTPARAAGDAVARRIGRVTSRPATGQVRNPPGVRA